MTSRGSTLGMSFALSVMVASSIALAGPATDSLRARQTALYSLLRLEHRNPRKINAALDELLDYTAMCQASLAEHWTSLSAEQRTRYLDACGALSRRAYAADLMATRNHDIRYEKERPSDESTVVQTAVVSRDFVRQPPLDVAYVMREHDGQWRVVDILKDGHSLVQSRRVAYCRIMTRNGFSVLITKLEQMVARGADPF